MYISIIPNGMAKDIQLDSTGQTVFHDGHTFVRKYPKIKQPVWMFHCERSDERGEECYEGGWKDVFFEHEIKPTYINVYVFSTPQLAQMVLDIYTRKGAIYLKNKFERDDRSLEQNNRVTDIQNSFSSLPLSGVDSGFFNEYKRSYKEHSSDYKMTGVRTYQSFLINGAFRKGRVLFTLEKNIGGFWSGYQGDLWPYRKKSNPNQYKRNYQDNENDRKLYELQKKQTLDFVALIPPYAGKVETSWLAYHDEFNNDFLGGKDFSEMSLAELVDLTAKQIPVKSFNRFKKDMRTRLDVMQKKPESMNPDFPPLYAEFSSYENDPWTMLVGKWYRQLEAHAPKSKAALLDFAPSWYRINEDMSAYYLNTIKNKLENGELLSESRRKIVRQGMIVWGTRVRSLQIPRDSFYAHTEPVQTLARESIFDILSMTGSSSGIRDDAFLSVDIDRKQLRADGNSSSQITISLFEQQGGDSNASTPLKGKTITIENVPFINKPVGTVSHQVVETDSKGNASVIYTAPDKENLPEDAVPRAKLVLRCAELNLKETVYIDLYADEAIQITPAFTIMPAHKDYKNELTFRFENPDKDKGKDYKAHIRTLSDHGRLTSYSSPQPRQELIIEATSGVDNVITWFWEGSQPGDSAVEEKISIEIPELNLSGVLTFSVGIDLILEEASVSWKPPFQPFLTIPVQVYIKDRFHPDADLEKLLADFKIEPRLKVEQTGYTSPAVLSGTKNGEDELITAAGVFLEQGVMGKQRPKALSRDLVVGAVKKTKENRWLLVSKNLSGESVPVDQMFPAIIPFVRGKFQVSVTLDPNFSGDALATDHTKQLMPIDVSRISANQGELEYFLLPTLKGVAGLTPQGSLGFGLTDIALKTRSGDYKGAIITAGQMMAGKVIGDGLGDTMKASYKSAMNTFYKKQTAKAFGTTVNALHPRQAELALRLAKPYKLAAWVETVTGWAVDQTIGELSPSGRLQEAPYIMSETLFARFGEAIFPAAHAETSAEKEKLIDKAIDYLTLFTQGYGNEYGVVVITRAGLDDIAVTDSDGNILKQAPDAVFAGKDELEMIRTGSHLVVIPFEKGKGLNLELSGHGAPVNIYKILDNKVTKGILDYQGKPWKKQLSVKG